MKHGNQIANQQTILADLTPPKKGTSNNPKVKDVTRFISSARRKNFPGPLWPIKHISYYIIKRTIDIIFSLLGLIILSPVLLTIAILIRKNDGRPIIFKQLRTGYKGKEFYIYKFRTMSVNNNVRDLNTADEYTKLGSFLRNSSLDELPQLLNVLKGDMSFIGPRPWIPDYFKFMTPAERKRVLVHPGITGLAQSMGRNSLTVFEKIGYDLKYVKHYSPLADLIVIVKTVKIVLKKTAADAGKFVIRDDLKALNAQEERL
ncbi:sugar transferase [Candidatus Saccharibacteria bacterium]|nr:sugar transferase [Candidatus Saccharibacteria bacterium]